MNVRAKRRLHANAARRHAAAFRQRHPHRLEQFRLSSMRLAIDLWDAIREKKDLTRSASRLATTVSRAIRLRAADKLLPAANHLEMESNNR